MIHGCPAGRILGALGSVGAVLALVPGCGAQWPRWLGAKSGSSAVSPQDASVDARTVLLQAAEDDDPLTRTHAVEALGEVLGSEAGAVCVQALRDPHPTVRFAAAMVAGDLSCQPAKARLLAMAQDKNLEPDRRVLCAVLYALHRLGEDRFTGELRRLVFDPEPEVRAHAAMAMGKMGNPSALEPLKTLLGDELDAAVRWQIRESLAMLGDVPSMLSLEGFARQPDPQLRLAAISALGRLGSGSAVMVLGGLVSDKSPPRVRVAAAGALARLGKAEPGECDLCVEAVRDPSGLLRRHADAAAAPAAAEVSSLRQLGARSLGWMGRGEAVAVLHPLLGASDGSVRVAAAMSILRIAAPPRLARGQEPPEPAAREPPPQGADTGGPRGLRTAGPKD